MPVKAAWSKFGSIGQPIFGTSGGRFFCVTADKVKDLDMEVATVVEEGKSKAKQCHCWVNMDTEC